MTRTHGNIERYQTHELIAFEHQSCPGWTEPGPLSSTNVDKILENKKIEDQNTANFFNKHVGANGLLKPWTRDFCGGVRLLQLQPADPSKNRDPNSLVWNIRTNAELIPSHTEILGHKFLEFVRQLYDDTELKH